MIKNKRIKLYHGRFEYDMLIGGVMTMSLQNTFKCGSKNRVRIDNAGMKIIGETAARELLKLQ